MTSISERIRSDIEKQILGGELPPGDRLPTEAELMQQYGCSRMTVNKAVSALVAAGLVERRRKAGSFVAQPQAHAMALDIPDLAKEVRDRGQDYRFRLVERRVGPAEAFDFKLSALREIGEFRGSSLVTVGIHLADGRPFAYEERAVNLAVVPEIERATFDPESPGSWLLKHVPWTEAVTNISAAGANHSEAQYLEMPLGTPCLALARQTWRGEERVTSVRQIFVGSAFSLNARFGAKTPS